MEANNMTTQGFDVPRGRDRAEVSPCERTAPPRHWRSEPVALEVLAEAAGVQPMAKPLLDELSGFYMKSPESIYIVVNSKHSSSRRRFTVAHELAHAAHRIADNRPELCTNAFTFCQRNKSVEDICDKVAAEILMPADPVLLEVMQAGKTDSYALARQFDVSLTAMRARLRGLGLL